MRTIQCSKRKFVITFIQGDEGFTTAATLPEILDENEEWEWKFSVHEEIDNVLDLKIGECYFMKFNRDNPDSNGVIKRIQ